MNINQSITRTLAAVILALGLVTIYSYQGVQAQRVPPTEHKGVSVTNLGVISGPSMSAQIGLHGYKMQLREIILEPGGQIARHDHLKRPGLVWTLSGSWVEGRPDGEKAYPASLKQAILEDATTEHWFWNDSNNPARVVVCDIVPDQ